MCCEHCHREITPGTERTVWYGVKRWVRVCALCLPFATSIAFGEASPPQAPQPVLYTPKCVKVDSGLSDSTLSSWYLQQKLNGFCLVDHESDDRLPVASLTMPYAGSSPALPGEDHPAPEHPPEGSTFNPISGSGAMANTNAAMTVTTWEPPDPGYSTLDRIFASQRAARGVMLGLGSVTRQHRPLVPRARRNCWS
jgi:hypothetical protein